MVQTLQGLLIGDKGYLSAALQYELQRVGVALETSLRSNMQDSHDPACVALLGGASGCCWVGNKIMPTPSTSR
jgi:hypothetical protein